MPVVGVKAACEVFGFPRASFYRKKGAGVLSPAAAVVRHVPRGLVPTERETVLSCLHEERFQNSSPAAVYATLLDEGRYHCSIRTMYRLLESEGEVRERPINIPSGDGQRSCMFTATTSRTGPGWWPCI